jgi:hypothetical protein
VDRNRKAANEEIDKGYPETDRRMRRTLVSGNLHGLLVDQAHLLQHLVVLRRELQPLPVGDLGLLHEFFGAWGTVLALLGARSHGGNLGGETREQKQSARSLRRKKGIERERGVVRRSEGDK